MIEYCIDAILVSPIIKYSNNPTPRVGGTKDMKTEKDDKRREILGEGRFLRLVRENGWEHVEQSSANGAAAILALTDEEEIIFIEQYRPPVKCSVIELPAGMIADHEADPDEEAIEAARRELLEETGYAAGEIRFLGRGPSSAGLAAEIIDLFFASRLTKSHDGGGVGHEDITVYLVPWREVRQWLAMRRAEGAMIDLRVFAAFEMAVMEGLLRVE